MWMFIGAGVVNAQASVNIDSANQVLKRFWISDKQKLKTLRYLIFAEILSEGNYEKSQKYYEQARKFPINRDTAEDLMMIEFYLAKHKYVRGDFKVSKLHIDKSYEIYQKTKSAKILGLYYRALSSYYFAQGNFIQLRKSVKSLDSIALSTGESELKMLSEKLNIMVLGGLDREYKKAIELSFEFLNKYYKKDTSTEDISQILEVINYIGAFYYFLGYSDKAADELLKGWALADHTNISYINILITLNLGSVYDNLKQDSLAVEYFKKSISLAKKLEVKLLEYSLNNYLGNNYIGQQKYEEAKNQFKINLKLDISKPNRLLNYYTSALIGTEICNLKLNGTYNSKNIAFVDSIIAHKHIKASRQQSDINRLMGLFYQFQNQHQKAIPYLKKSLETSDFNLTMKALPLLAKAYEEVENDKLANYYFKKIISNKDSLLKSDFVYQVSSKEQKFQYQKETKILEELNAKKHTQLIIATGCFLLALIVLVQFYFYNQKIRKAAQQLKLQKEELEHLNQSNSKLLALISHDLKNPVLTMKYYVDLVLDNYPHLEESAYLMDTKLEIQRLETNMNNVIQWGISQFQKKSTQGNRYILADLVSESYTYFHLQIKNKNIQLTTHVDENVVVWVDKDQILLALNNVLSNAIKFTPKEGQITISTTLLNDEQLCKLSIKDSGIGMPKEVQDVLFESNETKIRKGTDGRVGTGLGLMLSKELIEQNNGQLMVESYPGNGTTIHFLLPLNNL